MNRMEIPYVNGNYGILSKLNIMKKLSFRGEKIGFMFSRYPG